ncbi:Ribokinase-like protein [Pelagophyceae sp. CCMP2097]|nr:Ribokinase-like protein [Pelagophyceae sp. CCMP2097]
MRVLGLALLALGGAIEHRGDTALRPRLLVVGSANADVLVEVQSLPRAGETVVALSEARVCAGGKGANQACAASKLGAECSFLGQFGSDADGAMLVKALESDGVALHALSGKHKCASGRGFVFIRKGDGAVASAVCAGANAMWDADAVGSALSKMTEKPAVVMLQREVPEAVNVAVANAFKGGTIIFLDAGGEDSPVSAELLALADYVAPNRLELARLLGEEPEAVDSDVVAAAKRLQFLGAKNVLVTLGCDGAVLVSADGTVHHQPRVDPKCAVVDETGAGDAFRAAFAVALAEGRLICDCLCFAAAAGALAVTRVGGAAAAPTRDDCEKLLAAAAPSTAADPSAGGAAETPTGLAARGGAEACPWKFASRLNSMKDRRDLAGDSTNDLLGWIKRQGTIQGLNLVDFNFPEHLQGYTVGEVKQALDEAGLACGAVCLRYPASKFRRGAMTHPDAETRAEAIQLTKDACAWARDLGASEVVVWSAWCGYDYSFQVDYAVLWARVVEAFQQVCDSAPDIKVSLEYKPTDENTRFFIVPSTGAAMLLCDDVCRDNFGLTLDVGHCLAAGENPAQSAALVGSRGKLFGVQLNDGYQRIGAEDGLVFGSVHPLMALEMTLWLVKTNFPGHVYFDTFPRNEDPVREAQFNIRRTKHFWQRATALLRTNLGQLVENHDAISILELLEDRGDID